MGKIFFCILEAIDHGSDLFFNFFSILWIGNREPLLFSSFSMCSADCRHSEKISVSDQKP